jgi:hypothetical protein
VTTDPNPPPRVLGLQAIASRAFRGEDLTPLAEERAAAAADGTDAAALFDLSMILQSRGRTAAALDLLHRALRLRRDFSVVHGTGQGLRLLAFVAAGDFMANTPVDFLLAGSDAVLTLVHVDAAMPALGRLPGHDVAMLAIGPSDANRPVLQHMQRLLAEHAGPVIRGDAARTLRLTRDGVAAMLSAEPSILAPSTRRLPRSALAAGLDFPIIARPVDSHAGQGLDRLADAAALAAWLEAEPAEEVYVAPFMDYRGPDGFFAKQRVVFIDGRAFPAHMALSEHWMVHYLNAGMTEDAAKRAAEQAWMEGFATGFAARHAAAFAALRRHVGLDYFAIDCAELPDGRLLVFEVDVAMVIHDMDDPATFPYKKPAMRQLFDAFLAAAAARKAG